MDNGVVIDKENFPYLVTVDNLGYSVSYSRGIPRKSKKGYLGYKCMSGEVKIKNKDGAEQLFANWKEEFLAEFIRKEIVRFHLNYWPIYRYYVKCPRCGKRAEVLTFLMCSWWQGEEGTFGSPIACPYCCGHIKEKHDWMSNTVGHCTYLEEAESQVNFCKEYHTGGIKWDDFLENRNILDG